MTLTEADVQRLAEAPVLDTKGEEVGRIAHAHVLKGELLGVKVRLADAIASLPTVDRDELELKPTYLSARDDGTVALEMDVMDAITGHAHRVDPDTGAVRPDEE